MSLIEPTLVNFCQQFPTKKIIVAYSGGVDSQALLYALSRLKTSQQINNKVLACHVNHGLSANAAQWQAFAKDQCKLLGIAFVSQKVDLTPYKKSLEEAARDARYQVLCQHCDANSMIVTGHHKDDQSETFLLALKRGAGIKGLSAMQSIAQLHGVMLARPLLTMRRKDIVAYAKTHQLAWIEDESNTDTRFDRNFIRHEVMPVLSQRWPAIDNTMSRSIAHCQEAQVLLDELAEQDLKQAAVNKNTLAIDFLLQLSTARFNNLIRYFLQLNDCLMPMTEQLKQLHLQLDAAIDKSPTVKVGQRCFRRFHHQLYLTPNYQDISEVTIELTQTLARLTEGEQPLHCVLPEQAGELHIAQQPKELDIKYTHPGGAVNYYQIQAPTAQQQVFIRFSHNNETCLPDYRQKNRKVKKVLQELNIPPWQRKRIAFLYYDEQLVAALGHFVCRPFMLPPA